MANKNKRRALDNVSGAMSILAEGMHFAGDITGVGNLIVSGHVESDCDFDGPVTLEQSGRWKGSIRASAVVVAGDVEGDIRSDGKIEIADTARVKGSVIGAAIAVAKGAVIEGEIQTTGPAGVMEFTEKRRR